MVHFSSYNMILFSVPFFFSCWLYKCIQWSLNPILTRWGDSIWLKGCWQIVFVLEKLSVKLTMIAVCIWKGEKNLFTQLFVLIEMLSFVYSPIRVSLSAISCHVLLIFHRYSITWKHYGHINYLSKWFVLPSEHQQRLWTRLVTVALNKWQPKWINFSLLWHLV